MEKSAIWPLLHETLRPCRNEGALAMRVGVRLGPVSVSGRVGGSRRYRRRRRTVRPLRALSFRSWFDHPFLLMTVGLIWWCLVIEAWALYGCFWLMRWIWTQGRVWWSARQA